MISKKLIKKLSQGLEKKKSGFMKTPINGIIEAKLIASVNDRNIINMNKKINCFFLTKDRYWFILDIKLNIIQLFFKNIFFIYHCFFIKIASNCKIFPDFESE